MGHWYSREGKPCYQVKAKNGKDRDTTLADARKLNLVPSSTGIGQIVKKEMVEKWKRDILMGVICKHGKLPEDPLLQESWNRQILLLAKEEWEKASNRGTELHDKLENYFHSGKMCEADAKYLNPVLKLLKDKFPDAEWISEESFCHPLGYGGKVDLHCKGINPIIIDFKTKAKDKLDKILVYEDYCQQLASYRYGLALPKARCYNIIISTTKPQEPYLHEWKEEEIVRGYRKFKTLLEYWKLSNNYDPSFINELYEDL